MAHDEAEIRNWLTMKVVTGRFSQRLVSELAEHVRKRSLNVFSIYNEIGHMEGASYSKPTSTKAAAPFNGDILSGLWHKHYTEARFIPQNLQNHWTDKRFETLVNSVMADPAVASDRKLDHLTYHVVIDGFRNRSAARAMTGEWLVFAKHDGSNYYLTLGVHGESDKDILSRVRTCYAEFPNLESVN